MFLGQPSHHHKWPSLVIAICCSSMWVRLEHATENCSSGDKIVAWLSKGRRYESSCGLNTSRVFFPGGGDYTHTRPQLCGLIQSLLTAHIVNLWCLRKANLCTTYFPWGRSLTHSIFGVFGGSPPAVAFDGRHTEQQKPYYSVHTEVGGSLQPESDRQKSTRHLQRPHSDSRSRIPVMNYWGGAGEAPSNVGN